MSNLIIGIDVGLMGGISIIEGEKKPLVYRIPVKKIVVNKKNKNTYDMIKIVDIFKKYKEKKVMFYIERQGVRPGEGSVSALTIGKGWGQLIGTAYAFGFDIIEVTPQTWKKQFPELITDEMMDIKTEMKELRVYGKGLKDKDPKKENKKQIDKLGRQFKKNAKEQARLLVSMKYPKLSDKFKLVNSDGLAESLLIALYGKSQDKFIREKKQNELV